MLRTTTIPVLPRLPIPFFSLTRSVPTKMSSTQSPIKLPRFVSVEESGISSLSKPDGIRFSLVSYNILAQAYVKSSLFPHSPSSCLKWKARSQAILSVLKNLGVDFLCLQEVDEYESFYKGNMESSGYSSTYIQRSGQKRDGCGIFYKHNINRDAHPNDNSSARASISRIVMLAEALFEVLDEIHQQSVVLSSRPSVSSIGSVPAPNEVVESLPVKLFSKWQKHQYEEAAQCYICLVEYEEGDEMRILPCNHEFHKACIDKWLKEIHRVCPLCRRDICRSDQPAEN